MSSTTSGDERGRAGELLSAASERSAALVTDDSGAFEWVSPDAEELFGYTAAEVADMGTVAALFDGEPVDRERVRRDGVDAAETTVTTADGTEQTVRVTARDVPFGDGTTLYSVRDVTDRAKRNREYRLHGKVLETTDVVEFAFDPDGVFTHSRGKALRRLGLEDGEAVGQSVFDLFGDHPAIPDLCRRALDGETVDATVSQEDGTFDVHFEPIVKDGEVTQVVGLANDITELEELEQTSRELFDTVSDGLVIHHPETGEMLDVNERFCEMMGYSREDLVGEHVSLISAHDSEYSVQQAKERIDRARKEGPQLFEWRNRRENGETFPVEVNLRVASVRGEERVLASVRDVSDRKERERELEQLREVLSRVVRHDLRNALTVIKNHAELIDRGSDQHSPNVERILDTTDKLVQRSEKAHLVTRLTDREPVVGPRDLATVVPEPVSRVRESHPDARIQVDLETCRVEASELLSVAVENLVENAVEHNDAADPEVHVTVESAANRLVVEDNGPPIPEMELESLETVEERPLGHGSGLGLQLVRLIVTRSGGTLHIERREGGNRVELRLPPAEQS